MQRVLGKLSEIALWIVTTQLLACSTIARCLRKCGLMPETSLHDGLVDGDAIGRSRKVGVRIDQGALLIAG